MMICDDKQQKTWPGWYQRSCNSNFSVGIAIIITATKSLVYHLKLSTRNQQCPKSTDIVRKCTGQNWLEIGRVHSLVGGEEQEFSQDCSSYQQVPHHLAVQSWRNASLHQQLLMPDSFKSSPCGDFLPWNSSFCNQQPTNLYTGLLKMGCGYFLAIPSNHDLLLWRILSIT